MPAKVAADTESPARRSEHGAALAALLRRPLAHLDSLFLLQEVADPECSPVHLADLAQSGIADLETLGAPLPLLASLLTFLLSRVHSLLSKSCL